MHVTSSRRIVNMNHLNNGCLCCRNLCAFRSLKLDMTKWTQINKCKIQICIHHWIHKNAFVIPSREYKSFLFLLFSLHNIVFHKQQATDEKLFLSFFLPPSGFVCLLSAFDIGRLRVSACVGGAHWWQIMQQQSESSGRGWCDNIRNNDGSGSNSDGR